MISPELWSPPRGSCSDSRWSCLSIGGGPFLPRIGSSRPVHALFRAGAGSANVAMMDRSGRVGFQDLLVDGHVIAGHPRNREALLEDLADAPAAQLADLAR